MLVNKNKNVLKTILISLSKCQIIIMKPKHGLRQLKWVKMGPNQPKQNIKQPMSWGIFFSALLMVQAVLGCVWAVLVSSWLDFSPLVLLLLKKHYQ
jgi:hypothetical protein